MEFETAGDGNIAKCVRSRCIVAMSAALVLFSAFDASASPQAASTAATVQKLSAADAVSISILAESYPCAAMVLVLIGRTRSQSDHGTFQFEGFPSRHSVALYLDKSGGSAFDKWNPALLRSVYSGAESFVEVRWSLERTSSSSSIVTTSAQMVDSLGAPLEPAQWVEPSISVLMSASGFSLLEPTNANYPPTTRIDER